MDFTNLDTTAPSNERTADSGSAFRHRRLRRSPSALELQTSRAIINNAPVRQSPIDIALYFAGLQQRNERDYCFNAEWPVDYGPNPIIREFQSLVDSAGRNCGSLDLVGWSAAFVNWCLDRSGLQGTRSPESQSFRTWIVPRSIPAPGDIAVFADIDDKGRQMVSGQVAFWMADFGTTIQVVAANHRHNARARISEMPVARVRIDPQGRINRNLLGTVPIAALQQCVDSHRPAL